MKNKDLRTSAKIAATTALIDSLGLTAYYENVDWLTVKLSSGCPNLLTLSALGPESEYPVPFTPFLAKLHDVFGKGTIRIVYLTDASDNMVASVQIVDSSSGKKNRNQHTQVEFTGLFWHCYSQHFETLCSYFGIDVKKNRIVTRVDFAVDIAGIHSSALIAMAYKRSGKYSNQGSDGRDNYRNFSVDKERHELVVYDKKHELMAVDGKKKKPKWKTVLPDGSRPFLKYVRETFPITRVEFRKHSRSLREMGDSSIAYLFMVLKQQAADYFGKFVDFDLQTFFEAQSGFDRVSRISTFVRLYPLVVAALEISPADGFRFFLYVVRKFYSLKDYDPVHAVNIEKKSERALKMIFAYSETYSLLNTERALFDKFMLVWGERLANAAIDHKFRRSVDDAFAAASNLLPQYQDQCQPQTPR